ncbi:MAG: discoidin domain-containing protein, partial [Fibrobacterales bacterium]
MKIKNKSLQLLAVGVLLATSGAFAQSYTLLSQGQPASASGNEHTTTEALYVNDGNLSTRWASRHQNWEWIQIDLGSDQVVDRIVLDWEAAYASEYQVFVVPDGATSWGTPTYVNSNGQGGREELVQSFGTGRYVVIQGLERSWTNGNQYGISLFEFEVYQKSGKKVFWLGQFDAYPQVASAGDAFFHTGLQESFIYNNNTWEQFAIGAVGATGPQGEKGDKGDNGDTGAQ